MELSTLKTLATPNCGRVWIWLFAFIAIWSTLLKVIPKFDDRGGPIPEFVSKLKASQTLATIPVVRGSLSHNNHLSGNVAPCFFHYHS